MSLIARDFERRAKALLRAERQGNPALRADYKRQKKSESAGFNRIARRLLMPLFWNSIFLNIALKAKDEALTAAAITLWAAASALRWGQQWFKQFYGSEDLLVLNLLPLDDRQVFKVQAGRYLRGALWTAWELLLAYGVLGLISGPGGIPLYLLPLAALLQTVLVLALGLHAASRLLPIVPLNGAALLLYSAAIALLILGAQGAESAKYLVQAANWFLPTGWVNYILLGVVKDPVVLGLLLPIAGIVYLARSSWDRLQTYYSLEGVEFTSSNARQAAPSGEEELTGDSFNHRAGPTEIEEGIAARAFLGGVNWESAGWLERLASRFLDARERVITEFLVAQDPGWSRSFRWSFWVWLVSCLVVALLGQFGGTLVFFTAYILATASLPLFGGEWRGMRQTHAGGVNLPGFAVYPIAFNSIAWIFLKVNFLRILAALPFLLSFAAIAAWRLGQDPLQGLVLCAKMLGLLVCLQPLLVLLPISTATNDTARMPGIWLGVFAPAILVLLAGGVGLFMTDQVAEISFCYLLTALSSALVFMVYRRAYRRGRFDLLNHRGPPGG